MIKAKIEINEDGTLNVRERELIELPDGRTIDAGFHRCVIDVDDDPATKLKHGDAAVLAKVTAAVAAFHTDEVKSARRAARAEAEAQNP
jgi:hypothetical protein